MFEHGNGRRVGPAGVNRRKFLCSSVAGAGSILASSIPSNAIAQTSAFDFSRLRPNLLLTNIGSNSLKEFNGLEVVKLTSISLPQCVLEIHASCLDYPALS